MKIGETDGLRGTEMEKKIAFFDIDGTLINVPEGLMSPTAETISALKRFQEQGNLIFIATSRGELPFEAEELQFDGFIGEDGHYIVYDGQVLFDDLFTADEVRRQMEVYKQFDGRCMYSGHHSSWCDCWEDEYIQRHRKAFSRTTDKPANLIEHLDADAMEVIACCVMFKNVEDLRGAYEALKDDFTMVTYETGIIRMDVYRKGFKKGTAVRHMYEKLGIPRENTYAFGDGINDMEMLQLVGHGIAMGNAIEELKAVAEEVTGSVMENGIAGYFKKYLLK